MKKRKVLVSIMWVCLVFVSVGPSTASLLAEDIDMVPPKLQAGLFLKLLAFNKELSSAGDISVYVVGSRKFVAALKTAIGQEVGNARIRAVTEGDSLPSEKPRVIFVGKASMTDSIVEYTRANNILSITGRPDQVEKGVTLGVGVLGWKPRVLLNRSSSKAEGIEWNPAVLKIATVLK